MVFLLPYEKKIYMGGQKKQLSNTTHFKGNMYTAGFRE